MRPVGAQSGRESFKGHMTTCPMKSTCPTLEHHLLCMLSSAFVGMPALTVSCLIHRFAAIEGLAPKATWTHSILEDGQ